MFKEKGYDEFLEEQIRLADEQFSRGEFVTKELMEAEIEALFSEFAKNEKEDRFYLETVYG